MILEFSLAGISTLEQVLLTNQSEEAYFPFK